MEMKRIVGLVSVLSTICVSTFTWGDTWHVDGLVTQSGDGTSWDRAFRKIQEGIDAGHEGDTVIVAEGIYAENIGFEGKNIVLRSTNPLEPAVVAKTVIDGGGAGPVVSFTGHETEACILSGFTIQNGVAERGGGVYGGTREGPQTHATIENNVITGNSADYGGGLYKCNGIIENNIMSENSVMQGEDAFGAALYSCNGIIQGNMITDNLSYYGGGGCYCDGTIRNNLIARNTGGGLTGCNGTIENNIIISNTGGNGAGLRHCDGTVRNNLIAGNSARKRGGGLRRCHGTIQNNTIVGNSAGYFGGGLFECNAKISNCIIWGNRAGDGAQLWEGNEPTYSCIQDCTAGGEGNIAEDPLFVDATGADGDPETQDDNDYRLRANSRCIDAGANSVIVRPQLDLDGNMRVAFGGTCLTVDIGAYEYKSAPLAVSQVAKEGDGLLLIWNSQPTQTYTVWSCAHMVGGQWVEEEIIVSEGTLTRWTDPRTTFPSKFYRIELEWPASAVVR